MKLEPAHAILLPCDPLPMASRINASCQRIRFLLFQWYTEETRAGRHHTAAQDFHPSMVGDGPDHTFGLQGAVTNGFLIFAVAVLLPLCGEALGQQLGHWRAAGDALTQILALIRRNPWKFPNEDIQDQWVELIA